MNADDFGYSAETVAATIECFERGLLTSATLQPGMPASAEAAAFAAAHPRHSFGLHVTLVGDGDERPLAPPDSVPHLVGRDGRLRRTNAVRRDVLLRRLPVHEMEQEISAQLDAVRAVVGRISHVDSHRHLHKYPPVRAALANVLPQYGICRVRTAQDVYLRRPLASLTYWVGPMWRRALGRLFVTTDHFYMPTSDGDSDWRELLSAFASAPADLTLEIGVHPGYDGWRDLERRGLAAFVDAAQAHGHELVTWNELDERAP